MIHRQSFGRFPWGLNGQTAAAMREFGLLRRQTLQYAPLNGPGHHLAKAPLGATAWFFADARGAYGAGTYLRSVLGPASRRVGAAPRQIARQRWLLSASGQISARAWRAWVAAIAGQDPSPLPLLRQRLPHRGLIAHSAGYAEGPAGLAALAPWLPARAVNFAMEPIAATGQYRWRAHRGSRRGTAPLGQLVILSYPTPQIAAAQLPSIRTAAGVAQRSGSLVVAWHGMSVPQAKRLVAAVQYHPVVTWNHPLQQKTLPGLVLAIFVLVAFILGACLVVGFFAGGVRLLLARLFPRRFTLQPDRLIRLKLTPPPGPARRGS